MKAKKLLDAVDEYATNLNSATHWHNSEQSICYGNEMQMNTSKRFYIQEFLELMRKLEFLHQDHYSIRLHHSKTRFPFMFSRNLQGESPAFIATKDKQEITICPETISKEQNAGSLPYKPTSKSVLIRIIDHLENQVKQTGDMVSPEKETLLSDVRDKLPEYRFEVIEGLSADCVYATEVSND